MDAAPPTTPLRSLLATASAHRAAAILGMWLGEGALCANLADAIDRLDPSPPAGPSSAAPSFGRPELVQADDWVALAHPLPTAESLPSPHVVMWYVASVREPACWPTGEALRALAAAAADRFRPLGTWRTAVFLHGGPDALPAELASMLRPYKRWLAAPMSALMARPLQPRSERVRASTPMDLSFWPEYARMYEEFWASEPALRERIGMESPEDLEEYRSQGGLKLVWIDDELAGLVGGVRLSELGLRGWRLRERVLGGKWRGAGFATAALDAAVRDLAHAPGDLLWGTILPENRGSMGSAVRLGRVDVGGLWWV